MFLTSAKYACTKIFCSYQSNNQFNIIYKDIDFRKKISTYLSEFPSAHIFLLHSNLNFHSSDLFTTISLFSRFDLQYEWR